jgi:MFS family permease
MHQESRLGLRQNWQQFSLLVMINAFVGAMVGLERSIIPEYAEMQFGLDSKTAILSFIAAFGLAKAFSNYYAGKLADRRGRKNLLVWGWWFALPVPILLLYAPSWNWVVFANILLGINQALCWSSTVVMKIDLVGSKDRGLAMGLNEFAGYLAVGLMAALSGYLAERYGIIPYSFYIGFAIALTGLLASWIWVQDTGSFVKKEALKSDKALFKNVFWATTLKNKTLSSVTQAGWVNNLNDGMIWGLLPIFLVSQELNLSEIGWVAGLYPLTWGIGQLFTGKMADHWNTKYMLVGGMFIQACAIASFVGFQDVSFWALASIALGIGTALVYPTFFVVIAVHTHPAQRAESIGTFRLWRDLGYSFGALGSGFIADIYGIEAAIMVIALLTLLSSVILQFRL